jgi:hypothetical protein
MRGELPRLRLLCLRLEDCAANSDARKIAAKPPTPFRASAGGAAIDFSWIASTCSDPEKEIFRHRLPGPFALVPSGMPFGGFSEWGTEYGMTPGRSGLAFMRCVGKFLAEMDRNLAGKLSR